MCQLAIIIKEPGENYEAEMLLRMQYESMTTQQDGCAALWIVDGKVKTKRVLEVKDYVEVFNAVLKDFSKATFVSVHTRISTGGEGFKNVHFFKPKKHYFAHNGFVTKYSAYESHYYKHKKNDTVPWYTIWEQPKKLLAMFEKSTKFVWHRKLVKWVSFLEVYGELSDCRGCWEANIGYCKTHEYMVDEIKEEWVKKESKKTKTPKEDSQFCDSYQFASHLPDKLDNEVIDKAMTKDTFTGLGLLIKEDLTEAFLMVRKVCYAISDKKSYASFFSWSPKTKLEIKSEEKLCGVEVESETVFEIPHPEQKLALGVYNLELTYPQNQPAAESVKEAVAV